jgi:predicted Zn-dependent peptidase
VKMHTQAAEKVNAAPLERAPQLMYGTAFGHKTLGMPLSGFEQTLPNLTADAFNSFLQDWIIPSRLVFCANGLHRHEEFVQLVAARTKSIPAPSKLNKERAKAVYTGGECRMFYECPSTSVVLAFESVPWNDPDMVVFGVLQTLIGNATGFSMGGPGKGMHCRAIRNSKHYFKTDRSFPQISVHRGSEQHQHALHRQRHLRPAGDRAENSGG